MTSRLMRKTTPSSLTRLQLLPPRAAVTAQCSLSTPTHLDQKRSLANVRDHREHIFPELWFTTVEPRRIPDGPGSGLDHKPPDERTLKLGKTIRILHERLPDLLASPLPQDILSPHINLRLFPSTHPHLPTVTGKIGYTAALWTSPVAWGRVPFVGNVKLIILSERMGKARESTTGSEKLIVRWKTCGKTKNKGVGALYRGLSRSDTDVDKITEWIGGGPGEKEDKEFWGLFIFEFDEEGRILTHTIEHADEGSNFDRMTKVISVTDWLLGKAWGKKEEGEPGLALGYCDLEAFEQRKSDFEGRKD